MVQSWCSHVMLPLLVLSAMECGRMGTPTALRLCSPNDFSYLSIRTSFNFEAVWATVAHLFYPTTQEAFAHHMHQQALTLPLVHHCSFLGPLFIDAIHCRLGPLHRSALFWSSRLAISNSNLPSFPPSNTSTLGTALHLLRVYPNYLQVT